MKKTVLTLATLAGFSMAGAAIAQDLEFFALDSDASGFITFEELQVAVPDLTPETFAAIDTDGDGVLSPEEFAAIAPSAAPAP